MAWILCPTAVLPVNDIKGTLGCLTSASPARGPTPNTIFTTPGGTPEMQNGRSHDLLGETTHDMDALISNMMHLKNSLFLKLINFCSPASLMTFASMCAVSEVISLGLQTTVQPAAMAGAILNERRYDGRFHGQMRPATPAGVRIV